MLGIATINMLAADISSVIEELSLLLPVTKNFDLSNPFILSRFLSDGEFRDCLTICRFKYFQAKSDGKYATVKSLENNNPKALEKNYRVMADSFNTHNNKNRTLMSRRLIFCLKMQLFRRLIQLKKILAFYLLVQEVSMKFSACSGMVLIPLPQ